MIDLIQMKWTQLRAMESLQAVEDENLTLRRMVVETKTDVTEGRKKRQIYLKDWFISIKNEIRNLKYSNNEEISDLNSKYVLLSTALKKLLALMTNQTNIIETLNNDKTMLNKAIEEQNKKISTTNQEKLEYMKEMEAAQRKNAALKADLAGKILVENNLILLRKDYDKILLDNESYIINAEMLSMENKKIKAKLGKIENTYESREKMRIEVSIYK
jgi:hypothetical protein